MADDGCEIPSLPESIVMDEILPRLPVKSLIRFQSVSKYWLSYISKNPHFAKLHFKFSSMFRRQFFIRSHYSLLLGKRGTYFLLPHQECSDENDLEHGLGDVSSEQQDYFEVVVDCCNGLVCLYHQDGGYYNYYYDDEEERKRERKCFFKLWNPATRKCNKIDFPGGVHRALAYGFGYVPSLDDYKIVAFFVSKHKGIEVYRGIYAFSLKYGKWEMILENSKYTSEVRDANVHLGRKKIVFSVANAGLWHEGIIYWPMQLSKNKIMCFDLRNDEVIERISTNWERSCGGIELFRLKGSLALCNHMEDTVSEFWVLKDGDDWGSWKKLFSVNLIDISFITLSETSKCLVLQRPHKEQLKLVEFCKEALESCEMDGHLNHELRALDHVESLVSPFGMTS